MLDVVLRLRRDNDFNYQKIKDSFIPQDGEICLVDTAREGLRAVCGDGKTPFGQLEFLNDFIQYGYYKNKKFYEDVDNTKILPGFRTRIYIDLNLKNLYFFNGEEFEEITFQLPTASKDEAGILKLYDSLGYNTDGTMTQKAITQELNEKFELKINAEEELIIFSQDLT